MGKNARYKDGSKKRQSFRGSYRNRTDKFLRFYSKPRKTICPHCAKVMRTESGLCPICKHRLITISYRAKLPKKNAPFKKWREFWEAHNEWCSKRPYFKDQTVVPVIDHRNGTLHVEVQFRPPVAVHHIDINPIIIDPDTGVKGEVVSKVKNEHSTK